MRIPLNLLKASAAACFSLLPGFCSAQSSAATSSPYSRYGIGDLQFRGFAQNFAMGGLGQGLRNASGINFLNPASYSAVTLTTFEGAVNTNFITYRNSSLSQQANTTNLAYLALAFPVSKKWGLSAGLIPFSNVGYQIVTRETADSIGNIQYEYSGSGGVNRFYIGNAFALTRNLSLGLNVSYLFGSINRVRTVDFLGHPNRFNLRVTNRTNVGGFHFNYGLQYSRELKNGYSFVAGLSGTVSSRVRATRSELGERFDGEGTVGAPLDTVTELPDQKGFLTFPAQLGGGLMLRNNRFMAGIDYSVQNWSQYREFGEAAGYMSNSSQLSAGLQFTPNPDALRNYLNIVQYRAGARYSDTYLKLNGVQLSEYGVSAGVGLPLRKVLATINLSAEYGRRGTLENNLIREEYWRLNLGFTFNDKWFIKRKVD
jgi:hypothetical protein